MGFECNLRPEFEVSVFTLLHSEAHVVNDGAVRCCGLVIHTPASAYKLQPGNDNLEVSERRSAGRWSPHTPALSHQLFDQLFLLVPLFAPPPPEESRLHVNEPSLPVLSQGGDDTVQDVLNSRPLDLVPN